MTGRLILVRHGQTTSNEKHKLDTDPPGAELTALGREQASAVGAELAEFCEVSRGNLGRIAEMYCGITIRTQQTAMLAARSIEKFGEVTERALRVVPATGIHELSAGDMEMRNTEDAHKTYSQALHGWLHDDKDARTPGDRGEGVDEFLDRYRPVIEDIVERHLGEGDRDVIVVSHGAAIRTFATHATGTDPEFAFAGYLPNCRFVVLEPNAKAFGGWDMVRWADLDHQI